MSDQPTNLERTLLTERNRLWHEAEGLRREVERLTENRDFWHDSCQQAWAHRDGANRRVAELEADLAAARAERDGLRARLRQTQRILWDDESDDLGCATAWEQALLRTRAALATLPTPPNGGTE